MPLLDAPPVTTESFRKLAQFNEQRQKPTLVPLDPAHIPIQVIKDSQRRQELFDVIFPHDPSNDPHTVVTLSTEPFPRSPRSPPEAKAPGTSDDSNANDLSHCAITISDAGARHALCSIVGEADRPPKPIDVYPVLVHCFLFLPFDQRTLFAISHTCRAWRLASAQLPQWSLLPSLCYAFDEKAPHNVLPLTEHFADHADVELAKNASSRDEVMHFAKATKEAFTALNIDVDEGPASTTEAFVSALHFTVLSLTAAGVAGFLIIAWAIGTAYGIFTSDALIVFGYLAGATMLYSVCVPMIINPYNDCQFQPHNPRVAERFTIAHSPFLVLLAVTAFTLGTPMSLISARVAVAKDLERGPQLFYGPTTDACRLDMTSRPIYVHITDLSLWRVSPTPYAGSSAPRPAGCPSTTSPSWWVDTFLSYSGNWSDFTCFDNPVGDVSVVYLIPPTSGVCNEAGPIAVPFLPTSDSFRDTITTTWGAARHSTNPMWFRATVSSYWFDVEGNSFARTWYDNVNSTWTAHFNDTSIVPSKVSQIPLMTLAAVLPPDELVSKWQFRMLIPIVLAVVCFACTVLAICVSWVRVSSFATDIFSLVLAILALSPLLCISMGVYCHVTQDVDTCYMGEKGGLVLIIAGLVVLGLGACAGGVYAGWRRWSK